MNKTIKACYDELKNKKNVIGFSKNPKLNITNGVEANGTYVRRIYVTEKEPLSDLKEEDIIPETVCNTKTDVVAIGKIKPLEIDRMDKFRPVELGISTGNIAISAGSSGMLYETLENNMFGIEAGKIVLGSNAHVLTDNDVAKTPDQVKEKRIVQPGVYHSPIWFNNVVGNYLWHKQIYPSTYHSSCKVSNLVANALNATSKLLNRRTTFKAVVEDRINTVDFAVYDPTTEHLAKVSGDFIKPEDKFVGHLFAGSQMVGVMFGLDKILQFGIKPLLPYTDEHLKVKDVVKGVSFWGEYETTVFDDSAVITINYDNYDAMFEDVILLKNEGVIKGGWSGSGWYLKGA